MGRQWKEIFESQPARHADMRDQTAWNRLLLDTELRVMPFEHGEIQFPFHLDKGFLDYKQAALLHFVGGDPIARKHYLGDDFRM